METNKQHAINDLMDRTVNPINELSRIITMLECVGAEEIAQKIRSVNEMLKEIQIKNTIY